MLLMKIEGKTKTAKKGKAIVIEIHVKYRMLFSV